MQFKKASSLPRGDVEWSEAASEVAECGLGRKIWQYLRDARAPRVEFTLTLFILFIVFIGYKLSVATIAMGFENVFPNSATFFMP